MPSNPVPPVARRTPVVTEVHGERRIDDYHWLRNKGSRPVNAYLRAENAYTAAMMKPSRSKPSGSVWWVPGTHKTPQATRTGWSGLPP